MKIRSGFVSNSSSSSFVMAFAQIDDEGKFDEWCEKNDIEFDGYDTMKLSFDELIQKVKIDKFNRLFNIDWASSGGCIYFGDKEISELDQRKSFFAAEIIGDEGDYEFSSVYDEDADEYHYTEINYDIDESFFSGKEEAILNISKENGLSHIQTDYGAGRNG